FNTPEQIKDAITALEEWRTLLGDTLVDMALAPLKQQLAEAEGASIPPSIGERKLVTIMFANIAGFTAMLEALDPEQVRNLMNDCFDVLVHPIETHQGTIDKFIGDGMLAVFGAPAATDNHAERALRAALAMMEALERFNNQHMTSLGLHFGIYT